LSCVPNCNISKYANMNSLVSMTSFHVIRNISPYNAKKYMTQSTHKSEVQTNLPVQVLKISFLFNWLANIFCCLTGFYLTVCWISLCWPILKELSFYMVLKWVWRVQHMKHSAVFKMKKNIFFAFWNDNAFSVLKRDRT
jgi:hypothetical protein